MSASQPTILVIIGITGDLSSRKLLPAIEKIARAGAAPEQFRVVGITRRPISPAEVLSGMPDGTSHEFLDAHLTMHQMDLARPEAYKELAARLSTIDDDLGGGAQRLFYLAVPPQISQPIVTFLGESGLAAGEHTKLLLEKPFGTDLASAEALIAETKRFFTEEQLYRIDHFLAKEMAQNMVVFREGNSLFKRTWNKDFIASIDIIAHEQIGIEGRTTFYEQTGALRDVVQSHLLQLVALTLMETPAAGKEYEVPARRLAALKQLRVPHDTPVPSYAIRGQYKGYKDEVGNPHSAAETYVALRLESDDPRWEGVPIRVSAGKALDEKTAEIRITYKKDHDYQADQLIITLQPNEGVALHLWTKVPGYEWRVENCALRLTFKDHFANLPEPYEQVLLDAIHSNHTLFTSSDEVQQSWRIIAPIQQAWLHTASDLQLYEQGSAIKAF